jgi:hypothetical protein
MGGAVGGVVATLSLAPSAHRGLDSLAPLGGSVQAGAGGFVAVDNGGISAAGTRSSDASISAGNGTGPSLIFVNRNTATATKIVIVTSGRIELIVRPP